MLYDFFDNKLQTYDITLKIFCIDCVRMKAPHDITEPGSHLMTFRPVWGPQVLFSLML